MADITQASTGTEVVFSAETQAGEEFIGGREVTFALPADGVKALEFKNGAAASGLVVRIFQ
jgi:hypothetical protein